MLTHLKPVTTYRMACAQVCSSRMTGIHYLPALRKLQFLNCLRLGPKPIGPRGFKEAGIKRMMGVGKPTPRRGETLSGLAGRVAASSGWAGMGGPLGAEGRGQAHPLVSPGCVGHAKAGVKTQKVGWPTRGTLGVPGSGVSRPAGTPEPRAPAPALGAPTIQVTRTSTSARRTTARRPLLAPCEVCASSKLTKRPVSKHASPRDHDPFEMVYIDILGPFSPQGLRGQRYALLIVDDKTRKKWTVRASTKDGLVNPFFELVDKVAQLAQHNKTQPRILKKIQSDSDAVFKSATFRAHCTARGIVQQFSAPDTQAMNGVVERAVRTVNITEFYLNHDILNIHTALITGEYSVNGEHFKRETKGALQIKSNA